MGAGAPAPRSVLHQLRREAACCFSPSPLFHHQTEELFLPPKIFLEIKKLGHISETKPEQQFSVTLLSFFSLVNWNPLLVFPFPLFDRESQYYDFQPCGYKHINAKCTKKK